MSKLDTEDPLHILEVDNKRVRMQQIERLAQTKSSRDSGKVKALLEKISKAASNGSWYSKMMEEPAVCPIAKLPHSLLFR